MTGAQNSHKPPLMDADTVWQEDANCLGLDTDLFFPERGVITLGARRVCGNCDVRTQCLEFALTHGERYGTWGGLSETQRRELRVMQPGRPLSDINHGTEAGYKIHRRRGETACWSCLEANRLASHARDQKRRNT